MREGNSATIFFYRLYVVSGSPAPLPRARREDIPLLINAFLQEYARQNQKRIAGLSAEAQEILQRYEWPGNIRALP